MILVLGANGQIGREIVQLLEEQDRSYVAFTSQQLDITNRKLVDTTLMQLNPTVIINAAAYTDVPGCEENAEHAMAVNAIAAGTIAEAATRLGSRMIHISTDYVFDGLAHRPYEVDAPRNPLNIYGRSKSLGEDAVLTASQQNCVLRTSWVYGKFGNNFVKTILNKGRTLGLDSQVEVVSDQFGQPTWARDVARGLVSLALSPEITGYIHFSNTGEVSWYEFACAIFEEMDWDKSRVKAISSKEYPAAVSRPMYSVLSLDSWHRTGLGPLKNWRDSLHEAQIHKWI